LAVSGLRNGSLWVFGLVEVTYYLLCYIGAIVAVKSRDLHVHIYHFGEDKNIFVIFLFISLGLLTSNTIDILLHMGANPTFILYVF